ncbi:MAG: permease-like cell division protein FtsX, partial [Candidatus Absconditicoccaceae bacterium]
MKYISKLTKHEVNSIFKIYGKELFGVGFLVGFLFFLLNVFLGLSIYTSSLSDTLKDKLGIYFYIRDVPGEENSTYKKIITLKEDLEKQGLKVAFSSKEDAFKFLEKRVPELITNLKKFDIKNPLPATLYVMFQNDNQYETLKNSILKYKDIILNIKDIDESSTLKQQENRVLNIINFTNFIMILSYTLIVVLGLIILAFLLFLVNSIFNTFHTDLSIKKILGATSNQIKESFLRILLMTIGIAFVFNIVLLGISGYISGFYLDKLFEFSLGSYIFSNIFTIVIVLIIEMAVTVGISFYSSS